MTFLPLLVLPLQPAFARLPFTAPKLPFLYMPFAPFAFAVPTFSVFALLPLSCLPLPFLPLPSPLCCPPHCIDPSVLATLASSCQEVCCRFLLPACALMACSTCITGMYACLHACVCSSKSAYTHHLTSYESSLSTIVTKQWHAVNRQSVSGHTARGARRKQRAVGGSSSGAEGARLHQLLWTATLWQRFCPYSQVSNPSVTLHTG